MPIAYHHRGAKHPAVAWLECGSAWLLEGTKSKPPSCSNVQLRPVAKAAASAEILESDSPQAGYMLAYTVIYSKLIIIITMDVFFETKTTHLSTLKRW